MVSPPRRFDLDVVRGVGPGGDGDIAGAGHGERSRARVRRDWLAADNVIVPLVDTSPIVVVPANVVPELVTVATVVPPTSRMFLLGGRDPELGGAARGGVFDLIAAAVEVDIGVRVHRQCRRDEERDQTERPGRRVPSRGP